MAAVLHGVMLAAGEGRVARESHPLEPVQTGSAAYHQKQGRFPGFGGLTGGRTSDDGRLSGPQDPLDSLVWHIFVKQCKLGQP